MKYAFALLCLLLCSVANVSQEPPAPSFMDIRKSANIFLAKCDPEHPEHVTSQDDLSTKDFCRGYISGLSDGIEMTMMSATPSCPPEGVIPAQMGRVAIKYMHDHPEKTHMFTPVLMFEAWAVSFPCPAKK